MINTAEANSIDTVAYNTSLAAEAVMYRLVVDRSLGFLYTAKQTRTFPTILMMFIARQIRASMTTVAKLRVGNSNEVISALTCCKMKLGCFGYCLFKEGNEPTSFDVGLRMILK